MTRSPTRPTMELVDRFCDLVTSYPAAVPIMTKCSTMAPDHTEAAMVMTYYRFCRDSHEIAILLAALCHASPGSNIGQQHSE